MKCSHADEAPPPLHYPHPAPPLFSSLLRPCPTSQPSRQERQRPVFSLHWPPPLPCSGPCVYSRDNPLPTATMQPDLQVKHFSFTSGFPVPTCSSFSEKRGGIGARSAPRGFSLSLFSLSLREDVKAKGGRDHDLSPGSGVGVEVSCLCTTCF